MDRTEYNEICQSRGYEGLTDEDNTYMKGDAVVCEYFDGSATVFPHCVIWFLSQNSVRVRRLYILKRDCSKHHGPIH